MNTITIELCQEDRARLDAILAELEKARPDCSKCTEAVTVSMAHQLREIRATYAEPETATTTPPETDKPAEAENEPQSEPVKLADIQQKVVTLSAAGKKDAVRAIVTKHAARVSDIPEDKRAEVLAQLTALEVSE